MKKPRYKKCVGACGRILEATKENFYVNKKNKYFDNTCKECRIRKQKESGKKEPEELYSFRTFLCHRDVLGFPKECRHYLFGLFNRFICKKGDSCFEP
jgi:hypothetical protein